MARPNMAFINAFVKGIVDETKATSTRGRLSGRRDSCAGCRGARALIKPLPKFPAVEREYRRDRCDTVRRSISRGET